MCIAAIPYFFEPGVGQILFVIVFAAGWQITKPVAKRGEDWKHGRKADNINVDYRPPYRRD